MPPKSRSFLRRLEQRREPDAIGEEGIIKRVELDDNAYMSKHWYHLQESSDATTINQIDVENLKVIEGEPTHFTPYWHKLKYYEYKLIHAAFQSTL